MYVDPLPMKWLQEIGNRYRSAWSVRYFRISLLVSVVLLIVAVAANTIAGLYAADRASNSVTDIILSNTPPFDVGALFIYSSLALTIFVTGLLLTFPKRIPFTLCSLALFWLIRALFVSATHIGPYPDATPLDFQSKLLLDIYGGGEFFSGHTGVTFLLALIFWQQKYLRYFFLLFCGFLVGVVLLGHLHYTIDVLSAFFITYTIYQLARYFFPQEHALFLGTYDSPPELNHPA